MDTYNENTRPRIPRREENTVKQKRTDDGFNCQFKDNRLCHAEQGSLLSAGDNRSRIFSFPQKQETKNIHVTATQIRDAGMATPILPSYTTSSCTKAVMQCKIGPKNKQYIGRTVVYPKFGKGVIEGIEGQSYNVDFGGQYGIKKIPAKDLNWPEAEDTLEVEPEVSGEMEEDIPELVLKEPEIPSLETSRILPEWIPIELVIEKGTKKKKWTLTLQNMINKFARIEDIGESTLKQYVTGAKKIVQNCEPIKPGTYPLVENFKLQGMLADAYVKKLAELMRLERFRQQYQQHLPDVSDGGDKMVQKDVIRRLRGLQSVKKMPEKGHPFIVMTKIMLSMPIPLSVGGVMREITHLYTQPGNETEIRCYLGNDEGAYQRVHTSLTEATPMTAHTMVQTGNTVAVPMVRGGGTRIGFDSTEEDLGFRNRKLNLRSQKQCTVAEWIDGQDFEKLSREQQEGCLLLAHRFNGALDLVCTDINKRDFSERPVTGISPDFKILDDSWLFGSEIPATPENEWEHEQAIRTSVSETATAPPKEKEKRIFNAVDEGQYRKTIEDIRSKSGIGTPEPISGAKGSMYRTYPLTPAQIKVLGEHTLIPTMPDGDCALNAVLESLNITKNLSQIRAEIATIAYNEGTADEGAANDMLQPGDWTASHIMLPILAQLLNVQVTIIHPNGSQDEPFGPESADRQVRIFHVQGTTGHYYGSQCI